MELQRRHSVNPVHGAQGELCRSASDQLEREELAAAIADQIRPTLLKCRKKVINRVVQLGDRQRGPEAPVRLGPAPHLGNPPRDRRVEHGLDPTSSGAAGRSPSATFVG